eukprot:4515166-Pleurochrysis_carterae.AAC.1
MATKGTYETTSPVAIDAANAAAAVGIAHFVIAVAEHTIAVATTAAAANITTSSIATTTCGTAQRAFAALLAARDIALRTCAHASPSARIGADVAEPLIWREGPRLVTALVYADATLAITEHELVIVMPIEACTHAAG